VDRAQRVRSLRVRVVRGRVVLALRAAGDFAPFANRTPEYTVAFESGDHVAAVTRPFTSRRGRVVAAP
jgi:hypothetical protein